VAPYPAFSAQPNLAVQYATRRQEKDAAASRIPTGITARNTATIAPRQDWTGAGSRATIAASLSGANAGSRAIIAAAQSWNSAKASLTNAATHRQQDAANSRPSAARMQASAPNTAFRKCRHVRQATPAARRT